MNKILILAKREFFQTVKKKSFWLSTLAFPILMIVIILISGLSSASADELFKPIDKLENGEKILILEETKLIDSKLLPQGFEKFFILMAIGLRASGLSFGFWVMSYGL